MRFFLKRHSSVILFTLVCITTLFVFASSAKASPTEKDFRQLMSSKHQFTEKELDNIFKNRKPNQNILKAISRPAEKAKPWHEYRSIFMTDKRIKKGVEFYKANKDKLQAAEKEFGVPAEIIIAIIGVETFYGKYRGKFDVVDALYTLGFHYPKRGKFFASELEHFLLMCREEKLDPLKIKGSYAGAMGQSQFISSSYRHYAVDFNGDKVRNLDNTDDAIGSVANYFKKHGWKTDEPVVSRAQLTQNNFEKLDQKNLKPSVLLKDYQTQGVKFSSDLNAEQVGRLLQLKQKDGPEYWMTLHNFYVITLYNHSPLYAMAVYQLSQAIAEKIKPKAS